MTALAAATAVLAVLLLVPRRPRLPATPRPGHPGLRLVGSGPVLVVLALVLGGPRVAFLAALAALVVLGATSLVRDRRRREHAEAVSGRVLETCEQLASELTAGQPPGPALERAAVAWAPLAPVSEAFRIGSDVPSALREVARSPGADDLRLVAAAWYVAHRTGQGLADAVDRVAEQVRARHATRRIVRGELASARATARLVAALPVLALAMGSGAGGDPWGFLLGHPVGLACLSAGLAFAFLGLRWIEAIARDVDGSA